MPLASLSAISSLNEICLQLHRPHGYHGKSLRFFLISFRVQHKYGAQFTGGAGQRTLLPLQLIPEYLTSSPEPIPTSREYSPSPRQLSWCRPAGPPDSMKNLDVWQVCLWQDRRKPRPSLGRKADTGFHAERSRS